MKPAQVDKIMELADTHAHQSWLRGNASDLAVDTASRERLRRYLQALDLEQEAYTEGRKDERAACALECAAIADGFQRTGEGNKDGRYDWMVAGAQECADALKASA